MSRSEYCPALLLLSHTLRALRIERDVSLRALSWKLGFTPSRLSSWETGLSRPPAEALGYILGYLQVKPSTYRQLIRIYRQADRPTCIEEVLPDTTSLVHVYEELAVRKLEWSPHYVPESLHTPEYIQAELAIRDASLDDIDLAIFTQQVRELDRPRHFPNVTLVGEAVWPSTISLPRLKNLKAGIVPTSAVAPGKIDGFTIYETEKGPSTVVLRHEHVRIYLSDPDTVKRHRSTFARLQGHALDEVGVSR